MVLPPPAHQTARFSSLGAQAIRRILEDIKGETTGPLPGVPEPRLPKELQLQFTKGEMRCSPLLAPELVHKQPDTAAFYTHMQVGQGAF